MRGHHPHSRVITVDTKVTQPSTRARLSGVGGQGATDGTFGAWLGTPTTIAGTWADVIDVHADGTRWDAAYELLDFHGPNDPQGYSVGTFWQWNGAVDLAVGGPQQGETWAAAAAGGLDVRWTKDLTQLNKLWYGAGKTGVLHLRMAHEFNGDWYPWSVSPGMEANFIAAWRRWANLVRQIIPQAKIVFCMNADTVSGIDWRNCYPGDAYVDVIGVDYYNVWPTINTAADFASNSLATHYTGSPKGVEQYRLYAASKGKPLAIPEWSSPSSILTDASGWLTAWHDYLVTHGGTGPGQILYELLFNDIFFYNSGTTVPAYSFYPATGQPATAATYRQLWSS